MVKKEHAPSKSMLLSSKLKFKVKEQDRVIYMVRGKTGNLHWICCGKKKDAKSSRIRIAVTDIHDIGPTLNPHNAGLVLASKANVLAIRLPTTRARDLFVAKLHRLVFDVQCSQPGDKLLSDNPVVMNEAGERVDDHSLRIPSLQELVPREFRKTDEKENRKSASTLDKDKIESKPIQEARSLLQQQVISEEQFEIISQAHQTKESSIRAGVTGGILMYIVDF